jgi:hypothetical protein
MAHTGLSGLMECSISCNSAASEGAEPLFAAFAYGSTDVTYPTSADIRPHSRRDPAVGAQTDHQILALYRRYRMPHCLLFSRLSTKCHGPGRRFISLRRCYSARGLSQRPELGFLGDSVELLILSFRYPLSSTNPRPLCVPVTCTAPSQ